MCHFHSVRIQWKAKKTTLKSSFVRPGRQRPVPCVTRLHSQQTVCCKLGSQLAFVDPVRHVAAVWGRAQPPSQLASLRCWCQIASFWPSAGNSQHLLPVARELHAPVGPGLEIRRATPMQPLQTATRSPIHACQQHPQARTGNPLV